MKAFLHLGAKWLTVPVGRSSGLIGWVGSMLLAGMMLLTAADVVGRYLLNRPIVGAVEIQSFLMAIVVGLALAVAGFNKGHIRVDVVPLLFPKRVRAAMDIVSHLISIGFMVFVTWRSFLHMATLYDTNLMATTVPIPFWPFVLIAALGMTVYSLVLVRDCFLVSYQAVSGDFSGGRPGRDVAGSG